MQSILYRWTGQAVELVQQYKYLGTATDGSLTF